jgi:hypothetical protein
LFSWQYKRGEKGNGESSQKDHQIHKSTKKEFKNADEPALAVNIPDGQKNLCHKRDP